MALIVQKFGGSSVANAEKIKNVCGIISRTYDAGNDVVVVLSAQGDTTDDLIEKAQEINPRASKREMDVLRAGAEINKDSAAAEIFPVSATVLKYFICCNSIFRLLAYSSLTSWVYPKISNPALR